MEEYIKLLELPEEFDLKDLKSAYRKKVLMYHPDKAANEAERIGYEALMKKLNEANEYLKEYLENHGGIYTKEVENNNYSQADYSEDINFSNESTSEEENYEETEDDGNQEETQNSSYKYEEPQKEDAFKEGLLKIKRWALNNPKKATIIAIIFILVLIFDIWILTLDSDYKPAENPQTTTQTESIQNNNSQELEPSKNSSTNSKNLSDITQDKSNPINAYMSKLQRRIKMNWDLPRNINGRNIKVTVAFKLDKYGQIIGTPQIKQSSGNEIIDNSCIHAIMLTSPFGPLPENINEDIVDMEMSFEANKQ